MSNTEQMISVPRELTESIVRMLQAGGAWGAAEQLRTALAQPAAQHQGDPVVLPARLKETGDEGYDERNGPAIDAWNACLDKIAKLGPLYARPQVQNQGEPVAVLYANGTVLTKADCGDAFEICCKVETPLYTHADAGEVEWLRGELETQMEIFGMQEDKIDTLRAQLTEAHTLLREWLEISKRHQQPVTLDTRTEAHLSASAEPAPTSDGFSAGDMADQGAKAFAARDQEVEQLRAEVKRLDLMVAQADHNYDMDRTQFRQKLAEWGALLRAVPFMPASVDRRPNDEDQPDGYLEGDRSWCDNNRDAVEWLIENHAAIRAALSASAEPSNDLCAEGAHEFVPFRSECVKCGEPYSAEASAPVERDELTPDEINQMAFEEGQPTEDGDGYVFSQEEFDLFVQRLLDRAALERNPTDSTLLHGALTYMQKRRDLFADAVKNAAIPNPGDASRLDELNVQIAALKEVLS